MTIGRWLRATSSAVSRQTAAVVLVAGLCGAVVGAKRDVDLPADLRISSAQLTGAQQRSAVLPAAGPSHVMAAPVGSCGGGVGSDYNGDGVADVAIGDPEARVDGIARAGTVTVVYGGTDEKQSLHQSLAEVPDAAEAGDQFGFALATYDANRDGCSDLVVAAPFEAVGAAAGAGGVTVLFGSPAGLAKGTAGVWYDQNSAGWGDTVEAGDSFGYSVAAGSTAAGEPYLAVGAPGEDFTTNHDAGIVHYRRGTANITMWSGAGVPGGAELDDGLGYSLAATPYHLAVGVPGEALGAATWAGVVQLYTHDITGTVLKLLGTVGENATQITDVPEQGDMFGKSVAMVSYRLAGRAWASLLLVGAPGEDIAAAADAGMAHRFLLNGSSWTHLGAVAEVKPQDGNYFGEQVRIGGSDLTAVVGAPGKDVDGIVDAGQISVFAATATPATLRDLSRGSAALPGEPVTQEVIGGYLSSSTTNLYVASPAKATVHSISWSSAAAGDRAPEATYTAGSAGIAAGVAFGTAVS